jgi:hypothetical protein
MLDNETTGHSAVGDIEIIATAPLSDEPPFTPFTRVVFRLDGSVVEQSRFEDVTLCYYTRNGTVIASENLGTFEPPSTTKNVSLESNSIP